jgi:hypothetical protein
MQEQGKGHQVVSLSEAPTGAETGAVSHSGFVPITWHRYRTADEEGARFDRHARLEFADELQTRAHAGGRKDEAEQQAAHPESSGTPAVSPSGSWTITAPDGRQWTGESPVRAAAMAQRDTIDPVLAMQRVQAMLDEPDEDPALPGWYVVNAEHLGVEPKIRAFGRDGLWWIPLGRGNGLDGWMTAPRGYRWHGPIADIDSPQPFWTDPTPPALPAEVPEV